MRVFHINDQPQIRIKLQNSIVLSKNSMNVLGVIFDSRLIWSIHLASAICKAKNALFALRLLKRFFYRKRNDSNFYSVLYYNAVIWLTPNLSPNLKQSLLSISACALRSCLMHGGYEISFDNLHKTHKKCTPKQIMNYQIALKLHKLINEHDNVVSFEHVMVMDQMICHKRV